MAAEAYRAPSEVPSRAMSTLDLQRTPTATAPAIDGWDSLFSSKLLIVTGKGGVGKTTAAATLALAARDSGRRTLLVEVEGRQGFSRTFGTQPWDYDEREFRSGLWGTAIDPAESVYEYLEMYYGIKRVQWIMEKSNAIDFVTTAAPGLKDLLLIGKIFEIESRDGSSDGRVYDTIILDAPPTGRIVPFLEAPESVTEIVRVGAIKRQAARVREMLNDRARTQAVIVTLLEEMPVQETVEAVAALREIGVKIGPVIANQVVAARLDDDAARSLAAAGPAALQARTERVGATLPPEIAEIALALTDRHHARLELQRDLRADLAERIGGEMLELPQLTGPTFDERDLELLADHVAVQVGESGATAEAGAGITTELPV